MENTFFIKVPVFFFSNLLTAVTFLLLLYIHQNHIDRVVYMYSEKVYVSWNTAPLIWLPVNHPALIYTLNVLRVGIAHQCVEVLIHKH